MTKYKIHKKHKTRKTHKTHKTRKTRRRQRFSKKMLGGGNFITRLTERPPPGGRFIYINGQRYIDAIPDKPRKSKKRVARATAIAITPPSNSTERTNDVVRTSIMPATAEILDSRESISTAVLADTNNNVVAASNVSLSTNPSGLSDRFIDSYIRQSPRYEVSSAREKDELKRQLQNNIYYDPNWINPFTLEVEDDAGQQFHAKVQQRTKNYDDDDDNTIMYSINDNVVDTDDLAAFTQEDMKTPLWRGYIPEW